MVAGGLAKERKTMRKSSRFYLESEWHICQSTNLFDQNGKEIFEGSILRKASKDYLVVFRDGKFMCDGVPQTSLKAMAEHGVLVGHILSNPELVEEKCVSTAKK